MIDFAFALLLAVVAFLVGKLILDRMGQAPDAVVDRFALVLPLGMGFLSLATLALGELGCLNRLGMSIVLGAGIELGLVSVLRSLRKAGTAVTEIAGRRSRAIPPIGKGGPGGVVSAEPIAAHVRSLVRSISPHEWKAGSRAFSAVVLACTILVLLGTALCALAPVTDGDALCYHLQVPKVFLIQGSVGFAPDLHETVYPLVTELLYALALEFRGPVACRWIQWMLGLVFAASVVALARPSLGRRAWLAGAIALSVPAVSCGMSAPLNDVALAAFGTAAILAWVRLHQTPSIRTAALAGALAGLALGVKYPALVLCGLLCLGIVLRCVLAAVRRRELSSSLRRASRRAGSPLEDPIAPSEAWATLPASSTASLVQGSGQAGAAIPAGRWLILAGVYLGIMLSVGGCWYVRAYVHTGNPVYPYFRELFGNSGLLEVLAPDKRPLAVTPWNMLLALIPLSLAPDRFDSFAHQFGPVFLLFLPALLIERAPRRVLGLVGLGYLFLMICLTERQSMRFVLLALGPMSVGVAYMAHGWSLRRTLPARLLLWCLLLALAFQSSLALARSRHVLGFMMGRESLSDYLARVEPTFHIGRWAAANLPSTARLIGQDHRGFYIPRPYTMELAHRRRTGLGSHGESPGQVIAHFQKSGFTHLLLCPPVPETAVEFDPTLSRILGPWLSRRTPLYRQELTDGDGVLRRYAIYDIGNDRLSAGSPAGVVR
jgi:hypothetical protein